MATMKFQTSSTFKRLVNAVGKVGHLKPPNRANPVDSLKLPRYYDKYSNVALFSGDWTNVKCDCVHFGDEPTLRRQLVLARIAKYDAVLNYDADCTTKREEGGQREYSVIKVTNYIPHISYISHGELAEVEQELLQRQQRSLMIPFDVFNNTSYPLVESLVEKAKSLDKLEKVVLCVSDDNTWNVINRLLKS